MTERERERHRDLLTKYALPPYDFVTDDMTVPFAIELAEKDAEIERLRAALALIASFGGKCLFSNTRGSDGDQAYREGSHAAWEQAADIARATHTSGERT